MPSLSSDSPDLSHAPEHRRIGNCASVPHECRSEPKAHDCRRFSASIAASRRRDQSRRSHADHESSPRDIEPFACSADNECLSDCKREALDWRSRVLGEVSAHNVHNARRKISVFRTSRRAYCSHNCRRSIARYCDPTVSHGHTASILGRRQVWDRHTDMPQAATEDHARVSFGSLGLSLI